MFMHVDKSWKFEKIDNFAYKSLVFISCNLVRQKLIIRDADGKFVSRIQCYYNKKEVTNNAFWDQLEQKKIFMLQTKHDNLGLLLDFNLIKNYGLFIASTFCKGNFHVDVKNRVYRKYYLQNYHDYNNCYRIHLMLEFLKSFLILLFS